MEFDTINIVGSVPEIVVIASACLLLMVDLFLGKGKERAIAYISLIVVLIAVGETWRLSSNTLYLFNRMFAVDSFATFFKMVFYLATFLTILLSINYIRVEGVGCAEYYILLLFALSGMMIMASAVDLLTIYVGLELMALPVYVLTGFLRQDLRSNEAAMKYVVLGAFSSGILLYGISLVYGMTGTTQLFDIARVLNGEEALDPALLLAIILLIVGLGFKLAVVPFHMWAPDAYEGAPTSITAFMSVGPKVAAFAVALRVFLDALGPVATSWVEIIATLSVVTMALGSIVALVQTNIKRMLAYSSISHAGYALLGFVAGGPEGIASVILYMLIYAFMNMGIFGVIVAMRKGDMVGEDIEDYTGLAKVDKGMALLMLVFLFSLAGIPPTAGFVGKFYIFMALVHKGFITLAVIAVVMTVVAAYFYIRIVMLMYMKEPVREFDLAYTPNISLALAIALFGTILLGILPAWFIDMAQRAVLQ